MTSGNSYRAIYDVSSTNFNAEDEVIDEKIDIINYSDNGVDTMGDNEDQDGPEYSSSFMDTFSGTDDEMHDNIDVAEVNSPFNLSVGSNKIIKKKKVTAQWREYINHIMWRCLWLELHMNQLLSQITKYDKKLLACKRAKQKQLDKIQAEHSISKLVPLTYQSNCRGTVKRRKRRRYEENVDTTSYLPNHAIFSYYENKRIEVDNHAVENFNVQDQNTNSNDDHCLLGSNDMSNEEILLKIEAIQRRVIDLKNNLNTSIDGKSSPDDLIFEAPSATDAQDVNVFPKNNDDVLSAPPSNHVSEFESDDIVSDHEAFSSEDNKTSSSSEATDDADIVQNLVRHLTSGLTREEREALTRETEENFLIDNPLAQEVYWSFERLNYRSNQSSVTMLIEDESHYREENTALAVLMPEPELVKEDVDAQHNGILQSYCSAGGNKRVQKPNIPRQGGFKTDLIPSSPLRVHSLLIDGSKSSRSDRCKRRKLITKNS